MLVHHGCSGPVGRGINEGASAVANESGRGDVSVAVAAAFAHSSADSLPGMTWIPEEGGGALPVDKSLGVMFAALKSRDWLSEHIDMRSVGQLALAQSRARSWAAFSSS